MEDDLRSTEYDDSLDVATRCWKRVVDTANKDGYREGIQDGEDSVLQEGFDIGYKDGFETAFRLGRYKSLSVGLSSSVKPPVDVAAALDKSKRGACWICSVESQDETSESTHREILFSEVLNNQRQHSERVINMLHEYFRPIVKESDPIDLSSKIGIS